jgi:N6-L-threonylcarbamoyladenine synthase
MSGSLRIDESTVILGIETSCDETAAAVVMGGNDILSNIVSSQIDIHARFGGVVPEVASRAHLEALIPVVDEAITTAGIEPSRIDAVAATVGPGLIGALLVGVSAAKALSLSWNKPFVGVNHMEAHLYAGLLDDPTLQFPLVVLLVSGGHTMIVEMRGHGDYSVLGHTIDDAAGEAYDKVARYLNLGYPGGPIIDKVSVEGNSEAIAFPRAMLHDGLNFSFSGLKTAVVNHVRKHPDAHSVDVAASFQAAVVDVLCAKTIRAAKEVGAKGIVLGGGVSANSRLRAQMTAQGEAEGFSVALPSRAMCTDNAAMIASAAWYRLRADGATDLSIGAFPQLRLPVSPSATRK